MNRVTEKRGKARTVGWLLLALLWLSVTTVQGQGLGYQFEASRHKITIPFELINNLIVVPVSMNGLEMKFIVDTGVRYTILVDKVYSDLVQIEYHRKINLMGADRSQVMSAFIAPNVNMTISELFNPHETLLVLEEDFLQFKEMFGADVQGIIGYELFRHFVVKVDYGRQVLTLYRHDAFDAPRRGYETFPIELHQSKPYLTTTVRIAGDSEPVPVTLLMDTGASFDLLLNAASSPDLHLPTRTINGDLGRGLGGHLEGRIGRAAAFALSERLAFEEVITFYQSDSQHTHLPEIQHRNGIIGAGILRRFTVIYDYRHERIHVRRGAQFHTPFKFNNSGVVLVPSDNEQPYFLIEDIVPHSPAAEAGLQAGDAIVALNGLPVEHLSRTYLKDQFKSRAGRRIRLKVMRDGEAHTVKFRLRELI